ncbi:short chain dehydrogenase [Xylariomycetidae sp. FL0641]|nr:short chain dehydrogenase [Xylariomycetidae sp. FL0641]
MAPSPVALITAGSAGLGAAAARLFAEHGYRVVVNYNSNAERADALVADLEARARARGYNSSSNNSSNNNDGDEDAASGPRFGAVQADLGRREDIGRLVAEAAARHGRLDVVFSNGGWTRFRGLDDLDANCHEEDWDRAFNLNVKAHLWLMQAAKPHLGRAGGSFITTASLAGVSVSGSSLAYSVTKAAQIHLVKALAVMAAPHIRVNSVSPGLLMTDWGERFTAEQRDAHVQKTKTKRVVTVEDVAEQVLTFAKSKSMTGVNVVMDGGFIL